MLIAPALYSATEETIKKIDNYVKNGGHLLMGYRSCFSDEELKIYHDNQPHMLTECIGATYDTFTIPADTGLSFREDRFTGLTCADCQAEDWMELLIPDNAEVWAYYHHPYWNTYAAVTHNKYGNGTATYVGCHMSKKALSAVVKAVADCASVNLPDYAFPVIRKQGINDAGKHIIYYFNYSSKPVTIDYDGKSGTNLIENKKIMPGTKITLGDWNLAIIEED
jgi:beta-galactosidase